MAIFNPKIPEYLIYQILERKQKRNYRETLDSTLVRSMSLRRLDKQIEKVQQNWSIGDDFRAAVKETRRSEKAKGASIKHIQKIQRETAILEIDMRRAKFERDNLKLEKKDLKEEISFYWNILNGLQRSYFTSSVIN